MSWCGILFSSHRPDPTQVSRVKPKGRPAANGVVEVAKIPHARREWKNMPPWGGVGRSTSAVLRAIVGACWLLIGLLGVVAVARVVAWDANVYLAELNSLNGVAYVPSWPVLFIAVLGRRTLLACAATLVVVAQLTFAAPEVLAARQLPLWVKHAPSFKIFDGNVGSDIENHQSAQYARAIESYHPDLVTLEEVDSNFLAQLKKDGAFRNLPYRYQVHGREPWGFGIASRYPLRVHRVLTNGGNPFLVITTIRVARQMVRLWVVHTDAPPSSLTRWHSDLHRIASFAASSGLSHLVVVGDFNASWGNAGFNSVLAKGLVDGAAARSQPFAMTWPENSWLPPVIRIDHILTGTGVATRSIATANGPGSDHRALLGTMALDA